MNRTPGRLSFVLPVTLHESGALRWRSSVNALSARRLNLLLESFFHMFALEELERFFVVCPDDQRKDIAEILSRYGGDRIFAIVDELSLCPEMRHASAPSSGQIEGWYAQQLLKLAAARIVDTDFYVTLDSDVVCVKPFSFRSLVEQGRAFTNVETARDYFRLYKPAFAAYESRAKIARMRSSARILGYSRPSRLEQVFFGETPVVIHASSALAMCDYITARHGTNWAEYLAKTRGWTEYTLYFQFLEMTNRLAAHHRPASPNHVLNLEGSVWQASDQYLQRRTYDVDAILADDTSGPGIFIAVQSWLNPAAWISSTAHPSAESFLDALAIALERKVKERPA